MVRFRRVAPGVLAFAAAVGAHAGAQAPAPAPPDRFAALATTVSEAARGAHAGDPPAPLVFTNRRIVQFRATVMARPPAVRAQAAVDLLNGLVGQVPDARATTHPYDDAVLVAIGDRPVFVIFPADIDPLAGESLAGIAGDAASRLDVAFREAVEVRTPRRLLVSAGAAALFTLLYILSIWALVRGDRRLALAAARATERRLRQMKVGELMVSVRAPAVVRRLLGLLGIVTGLVLTYAWLTAVLRRFPYTRPWGESLRSALVSAVGSAGRSILDELPNLLTVLAIVLVTRFLARMVALAFEAAEQGRITLPGVHPETVQPSRRIAIALLWVFALVVSYKYLPGSDSEVFKGVSVFIGLMVSLGSSGVMNQAMSGMMVTYSRALRLGDFVRIGEVEGTVTHLGTLSTKVRTPRNEEITIPNAVVASSATTNFSRHAAGDGVFAPTAVTIGYDVPWRQVHALLLLAAGQTPGVRPQPSPVVLQTALCDSYVQYTLLVCLDEPARRLRTLAALHANVLDAFNEYGVQIMSPNYEADPDSPKLVPPAQWFSSPAQPPAGAAGGAALPGGRDQVATG